MSDIFQEVDEALQQDHALKFWLKYRIAIFVGVAAIILAVAANEFLGWQKNRKLEANAEAFYTAKTALVEDNDAVLAAALFEEIAASDSTYAELAAHFLADIRLSNMGDKAAAVEALKKAAEGDGAFAETARLKVGYLIADDSDMATLESWLAPLTDSTESPYSYLAVEVLASRAFSLGDYQTAKKHFNKISLSLDVPSGAQLRAERALIVIDALEARNGNSQ